MHYVPALSLRPTDSGVFDLGLPNKSEFILFFITGYLCRSVRFLVSFTWGYEDDFFY